MSQQNKSQPKRQKSINKNSEPYCTHMTECHIEQATQMLTTSFIQMNPVWKKIGARYDQVYSVVRGRMIASCKGRTSFVFIDPVTNRLAGASYNIDLYDHFKTQTMPNHSNFFKILGKYASELQNQYFQRLRKTIKKGEIIYTYGGALDPNVAAKGYAKKFWSTILVFLREAGYKSFIARSTNRISTKGFIEFGTKIVKTVQITQPQAKNQFMELIQTDLRQLKFNTLSLYYPDKNFGENDSEQEL